MTEQNNDIFSSADKFHEELEKVSNSNIPEPVQKESNDEPILATETTLPEKLEEASEPDVSESEASPDESYKENKYIPKSRFNQEIEKRKALEEQLQAEREAKIRYETQLEMLKQAQLSANQEQPELVEEYDPLDPDAHKMYMREINNLKQKIESVTQETNQRTQQQNYYNRVVADGKTFEKDHPDFNNALQYLEKVEIDAARTLFSETEAQQFVQQKLQNTMVAAVNGGKNAAEVAYNMAKSYGYSPKSAQPKAKAGSNLDAINDNMKKSASINGLPNSINMTSNIDENDSDNLRIDPKNPQSPFDPVKFHKRLEKVSAPRPHF
jgi:hypothetical protein